jgi:hypothetical protein
MIPNLSIGQSEIKPPLAANLVEPANQKVPVVGAAFACPRKSHRLVRQWRREDEAAVQAAITSSRPVRLLDLNNPRPVRQNQRARSSRRAFERISGSSWHIGR